ncbi:MAG: NAD(P)H-dependent oxidoreductase [Parachlamydiales bacterium]|nr:NAD(P)H-dependent oxidoreductase [Parachlamydiales bacterium]
MLYFLLAIFAFLIPSNAQETKVLAFAGSTSSSSINKKLIAQAATVARELGAKVTLIDLKDYPIALYDADLEATQGMPENAKKIRELMIESDAIIIASPEHNASIPAVLKNTLDWASRGLEGGSSRDAFKDKTFALMSASPSRMGGSRGLVHLQSIIENAGGYIADKKVTVSNAYEKGVFDTKALKAELRQQIQQILE